MLKWHAHALTYPVMSDQDYQDLKKDIAAHGQREAIKFRVVNGEHQGLDGRHRYRACAELKLAPRMERVEISDVRVAAYIDSLNDKRRHMTREERQERIRKLANQGQSTREIAKTMGVSHQTVQRDLKPTQASPAPPKTKPSTPREAGDDSQSEHKAKQAKKGKPKQGQPVFDFRLVTDYFGTGMRLIDKFGKAYGVKDAAFTEGLRESLDKWRDEFKATYTRVSKQKAPN